MPAHLKPGSKYHGWFHKYRQYKTMAKPFKCPVTTSVCLERETHLRLVRLSDREWVTRSSIMNAALTAFLDIHAPQ
jgi:hypothetical protein